MTDGIFGTIVSDPEIYAAQQAVAIGPANNITGLEVMARQEMYSAMMRQKLDMMGKSQRANFNETVHIARIKNGWLLTFKGERTFCQDTAAVSDFVAAKLVEYQMMEEK